MTQRSVSHLRHIGGRDRSHAEKRRLNLSLRRNGNQKNRDRHDDFTHSRPLHFIESLNSKFLDHSYADRGRTISSAWPGKQGKTKSCWGEGLLPVARNLSLLLAQSQPKLSTFIAHFCSSAPRWECTIPTWRAPAALIP